ncbi:MAG: HAD hydrolase-like protein, partial [Propionibacteriaceae bacterium]|nr:HAD hydrolase-like protein [Propionibacteriaceae bacterium]
MLGPLRAVLFDLDETLSLTNPASEEAMKRVAMHVAEDAVSSKRLLAAWYAARAAFWRDASCAAWGVRDPKRVRELCFAQAARTGGIKLAREYSDECYLAERIRSLSATEGAVRLIDTLTHQGVRVGVVTNGDPSEQIGKIEALGIRQMVDVVVTVSVSLGPKPLPDMLLSAMYGLETGWGETVLIGNDVRTDGLAARAAQVGFVHLLKGNCPPQSESPHAHVRSLREVTVELLTQALVGRKGSDMCGVAGSLSSNRPVPLRPVYQMVEGLKHRGPDGIGVYPWKPEANGWYYALLGHARLQLVGDTNAGRQPLASMDGTCIASVNGEIYNYRSLWAEHFPGTPFDKAWSDCKVVADLYSKLGLMGISLLEGIYAGAILDVSTGSMVAFRDHFGTKPLYYTFARQSAYVCSEIRPLLAAANIRPEYSRQALLDYFHYQTPLGDRTLFSGVYTIPPGTAVTFSDNGIEHSIVPSPWRESQRAEHYPSLEQASQEYRRRFAGVMDRQWHPMAGAFLSGGTDSNSITSTLTKLGHRIPTYTARFATDSLLAVDSGADESSIGACLAKEYGLPHTSVAIDPDHLVAEMSQMIRHLEDLRGPMSLGAWRIAQVATGQCRVLFSGMGADEILGGYVDRIRLFSSRSPLTYGVFDELWG